MASHKVVPPDAWLEARRQLLAKEKDFTRLRDELNRQRRDLPWERVSKEYEFEATAGKQTLRDLFMGKHQLIIYHFMFPPDWDEGCPHCSFWADNFDGITVHLNQRDTNLVAISRAPVSKLDTFKQRTGWSFSWVSSSGTGFNHDYFVSFTPEELATGQAYYNYVLGSPGFEDREGISVFDQDDDGEIFHTYSAYARGIDVVNGAYQFLDLVPKGRDEAGHDGPQYWVRHHDRYDS